jgi:transposase
MSNYVVLCLKTFEIEFGFCTDYIGFSIGITNYHNVFLGISILGFYLSLGYNKCSTNNKFRYLIVK